MDQFYFQFINVSVFCALNSDVQRSKTAKVKDDERKSQHHKVEKQNAGFHKLRDQVQQDKKKQKKNHKERKVSFLFSS